MDKPNIIWIVGDALQTRYLGCYGCTEDTSPFIDSLAKQGTLFEDAYSCSNHTDSSITSMMTGKYPITHGILHHGRRIREEELRNLRESGTRLLPEILRDHGYDTINLDWLGRWHRRGYNHYGETYPPGDPKEKLENMMEKLPEKIHKKIKRYLHRHDIPLPARSGLYYTQSAIRYLKENRGHPFFMMLHNWDTHTPFDTLPPRYKDMFHTPAGERRKVKDMLKEIHHPKWKEIVKNYHLYGVEYMDEIPALYKGGVRFFDHQIQLLVEELKRQNRWRDTILIVTGDHGDNGVVDGVFRGHYGLYENVTHIPLIITGPGYPKDTRLKGFTQHLDLLPTLLNQLGIDYDPREIDGKPLDTYLEKKRDLDIRDWVLTFDAGAHMRAGLRNKRYRYNWSPTDEPPLIEFDTIGSRFQKELYDLQKDPHEENNLIEKEPQKSQELEDKLTTRLDQLQKKLKKSKKRDKPRIRKAMDKIKGL